MIFLSTPSYSIRGTWIHISSIVIHPPIYLCQIISCNPVASPTSTTAIMQSFSIPITDYSASPASTGIEPSKFDKYFSGGYQKQVLCAAHPLCLAPDPFDSSKSPHRCIGCGLHIHCELWCRKFWNILDIHPPTSRVWIRLYHIS
jgi:hypothetical protein